MERVWARARVVLDSRTSWRRLHVFLLVACISVSTGEGTHGVSVVEGDSPHLKTEVFRWFSGGSGAVY